MKRSRNFKSLAKSGAARALTLAAAVLLILEPFAWALEYKYPTSYTITPVSMGSGMTLEQGVVFGFSGAKATGDADAYADLQEAACKTPATSFTFGTGMEGFSTVAGQALSYNYSGSEGNFAAGAINTRLYRRNGSSNFQWNKTFFWDCGTPSAATFSLYYKRGTWNLAGATNNFQVNIVKPDLTVVNIVASTNITATGWTQVTGTFADPTGTFNQPGTYTLRINGTLSGTSAASANVIVHFDDVNLNVASGFATFKQETEMEIHATPYSSLPSNQYLLEIRARQNAADSENTYIQVWNGATWTNRYTVNTPVFVEYNTYYLTPAEYNNGNVRVRYVDADQTAGDTTTQGGVQVEYQRVGVDLGTCVDQVTDQEADCGKCHNYGGDITKPWPSVGMHNKHAQTESTSDCLWCHPNNGTDSAHRNGIQGGYAIELAGTKVYRLGGANPQSAAGSYDTATKRCSNVACHMGNLTPRWDSTYGLTQASLNDATGVIARNCSRCHNSGTADPDTYSGPSGSYAPNITDFNLDVAWPSTGDGGGHASHNAAFTIDAFSCQTNGSCHPNNTGQHSVVDDAAGTVVKMSPSYASPNQIVKYIPDVTNGTGTCANVSCHGGQQTPRFNTANTPPGIGPIDVTNATGCVKCHTPEGANGWGVAAGNASQYNSPISGLHRGAPPTSGKNHISDYSCTKCHQPSPVTHFKTAGVTNLHTTTMDPVTVTDLVTGATGVGTFTAGVGTSPNYTTAPTCATPAGTVGCHAEADTTYRNPATSWSRKWTWDAYDTVTPVNQCKNCHGHWESFSAGVVEPHVASNGSAPLLAALSGNHSDNANGIDCAQMCHAQTNAAYNHGAAVGAAKDMTVNSNASFVDNGSYVGCTFCHLAENVAPDGAGGNHSFTDATWVTAQSIAGPTPTCSNDVAGCHGNVAGAKYWPDGGTYPDNVGKHVTHMTKLAAKLYSESLAQIVTTTGNGTGDAKQKAICVYCHNTLSPGLAGHTSDATATQAEVSSFKRIQDGAADTVTAGTFATADGSCSNVDCHNNKATSTTYGWRSAAVSTCTMCHTRATTGNNPSSGLHYGSTAPTVSGKWHDDTLSTGCTVCHSTIPAPATSTHINGTFTGLSTSDANLTIMGLPITAGNRYTATADNVGSCSGAWVGGTSCHGDAIKGVGDQGTWARKWDSSLHYVATGNECKGCHGGFAGTDWTLGLVANTTDGSVEHGRNWDSDGNTSEVIGNHKDNLANASRCNMCHVYADAGYTYATNHRNGSIEMNSTTTYQSASWNCTSVCHVDNTNHNLEDSGWPVAAVAGPALTCISCHTGSGTGAFKVGSASSHTDPDGAGATYTAGNNCAICHHASHAAETTNTIAVTWDTRTMGTSYVTGDGKIHLKKLAGTETSEAEICWNCHWGTNMPTISPLIKEIGGTQGAYTTGSLNQRNWYGATWTSANFAYKNGAIASVHQALSSTAVDPVKDITLLATEVTTLGCVSCHDVHKVGNNGFTPTGQPYLRGSWTSNPFKEDGAPGGGGVSTWATGTRTSTGAVPRGAAMSGVTTNNELGGWQTEQNNAAFANTDYGTNPTTSFAGLCSKCHTKTGLEAIAWTGHKAAVSGFTGTGGSNVFSSTVRGGTGAWTNAHMGHQGSTGRSGSYVGGLRNNISTFGPDGITPRDVSSKPATGSGVVIGYAFGTVKTITMDGATVQADFHNFPCSKCHSPHASRLPRLMITNCLDVKHNTWDNTLGNPSTWPGSVGTYVAKQLAYSPTAGNCHRYVLVGDVNREAAAENGWNSVTPW